MLCPTAQNLIFDVVTDADAVSAADQEAFLGHVGWCSACRDDYEQTRALRSALQTHGEVSRDTVELLESQGHVVQQRRTGAEFDAACDAVDVEAGLARLMATLDDRDVACHQEESQVQGPYPLEDSVADLRRRVNTLEAYQEPVREAWRKHAGVELGQSTDNSLTPSRRGFRAWQFAACLSAAACLVFSLVAGWLYAPSGASRAPQASSLDAAGSATLEQITGAGSQPLVFGQPIVATGKITELLLGGRHRVVLNRGTTVTVEVDPLTQATPAGEHLVWRLDLAQGEMYAEVVPGSRFAVTTPNAVATITGTKFNLRADGGATELTLVKGSVDFASRHQFDGGVGVVAGYGSVVEGQASATRPAVVDVSGAVAWAQTSRGFASAYLARGNGSSASVSEKLSRLGDLGDEALMPQIPDYRTWSYERFRDEMRPWFAEQFPWAIQLEEALNEDRGKGADYLDILVISGDIWRLQDLAGINNGMPVITPSSVDRIAVRYQFGIEDMNTFLIQCGLDLASEMKSLPAFYFSNGNTSSHSAALKAKLSGDLLLRLNASENDNLLYSSVLAWVKSHPEEAKILLNNEEYRETFQGRIAENSIRVDDFEDWLENRISWVVSEYDVGVRERYRETPAVGSDGCSIH